MASKPQCSPEITQDLCCQEPPRQNDALIRSVLDNCQDVIYCRNLQTGRYEYVSSSCQNIVDLSVEEFMALNAETLMAVIHPDDRAAMAAALATLEERGLAQVEYRHHRKNGEYRWLSNHMVLVRDTDGRALYRNGSIRDITQAKAAEEALRRSEERFRSVLDNSKDVIYRQNIQTGRYEYLSAAAESIFGFTPEEMMAPEAKGLWTRVHPDDRAVADSALSRVERLGEAEAEYRWLTKKNGYRWLSNHMKCVRDKEGKPLYRNGNVADITMRKQAQESLRANEERLRLALQAGSGGAWETDLVAGEIWWSPEMFEICGLPPRPDAG